MSRQNIYDDDGFFLAYKDLRDNNLGLNAALEEPAMRALMPRLAGKVVVNLGCGDGQACISAVRGGAAKVVGVEPSAKMLALATSRNTDPAISYLAAFAEDVQFPAQSVDVVISSLAFHYVDDLQSLLTSISGWLVPGGVLLFSIEHPIVTASPNGGGGSGWALTDYFDEGIRHTTWFIEDVRKYHRTVGSIVGAVIDAGLTLDALVEPSPLAGDVSDRPELAIHADRPALLVVRCSAPERGVVASHM